MLIHINVMPVLEMSLRERRDQRHESKSSLGRKKECTTSTYLKLISGKILQKYKEVQRIFIVIRTQQHAMKMAAHIKSISVAL